MPVTRSQLHGAAEALCSDFAAKASTERILAHFSTTHAISAREHGLQELAPFLGRTFTGRTGPLSVEGYFKLLQKYLTYENMSFAGWMVDVDTRKVSVVGKARFKWIEGVGEGQWWDEQFVYVLDFDDEAKITDYQVWADSGAAYLAQSGKLNELREESDTTDKT